MFVISRGSVAIANWTDCMLLIVSYFVHGQDVFFVLY